jgi:hypothetical protein
VQLALFNELLAHEVAHIPDHNEPENRMPRRLIRRDGIWHYRRRVPTRFAEVDARGIVRISLETRDLRRAEQLKIAVEADLEAYWLALTSGGQVAADAAARYKAAIERARIEGFAYRPAIELAQDAELPDLLARLARLEQIFALSENPAVRREAAEAIAGGADPPRLLLSTALDEFFRLTRDRVAIRRSDFQRETLLALQTASQKLIRTTGASLHQDIVAHRAGGEWQRQPLPGSLSDDHLHWTTETMLLASRVRDDEVRILSDQLRCQSAKVGLSRNEPEAERQMSEAAITQTALVERIGFLLREIDEIEFGTH